MRIRSMSPAMSLVAMAMLSCCSRPTPSPSPTATPGAAAVAESPPSAAALAARAVAQDYFDRLKARNWREAHALWTPEAGGPLPAFAAAMAANTDFAGTAGKPSAVRSSAGQDFVLVEAFTDTATARHAAVRRDGVVMLKRPAGSSAAWRIWGTDIRVRHCKRGERAQGLGCIKA